MPSAENLNTDNVGKEIGSAKPSEKETAAKASDSKFKKVSLFDDDNLFEDDLFSNMSTRKFTSGLFDDSPPDDAPSPTVSSLPKTGAIAKDRISINSVEEEKEESPEKVTDVFNNTDYDSLFGNAALDSKSAKSPAKTNTKEPSFEKPILVEKPNFSGVGQNKSAEEGNISAKNATINLFDPSPPPDVDDWDIKSQNNLFDDDILADENTADFDGGRSSNLFDNEPPSLFSSESGIVRDRSSR